MQTLAFLRFELQAAQQRLRETFGIYGIEVVLSEWVHVYDDLAR
jgi:hypothetical protein